MRPTFDQDRLNLEKSALETILPKNAFTFGELNTDRPYVLMGARTNSGKIYTIRVNLKGFPNTVPDVVIDKLLLNKDGEPLELNSMHAYNDEKGRTHICHYSEEQWNPWISLVKVYIKSRFWLEMYDLHLLTGNNIDYYVNRQGKSYRTHWSSEDEAPESVATATTKVEERNEAETIIVEPTESNVSEVSFTSVEARGSETPEDSMPASKSETEK